MKKVLFILFAIATVFGSASAAENCTGIEAGAKAYNDGDFERAIDEWRTCADNGFQDADLFYNLGNSYFRNGNLGFSIFYYKEGPAPAPQRRRHLAQPQVRAGDDPR